MLTWSNHGTTGEHFAFYVTINRESMQEGLDMDKAII